MPTAQILSSHVVTMLISLSPQRAVSASYNHYIITNDMRIANMLRWLNQEGTEKLYWNQNEG